MLKLGRKKKENLTEIEELNKLQGVIDGIFEDTKPVREQMTRYLKRYVGKWYNLSVDENTESKVFVNLLFATVQTVAPLLTDNRPIWSARARRAFMQNYISAHSLGLEYLWDKLEMDMKLFKFVLDALIMKMGIAKIRFDPDTDDIAIDVVDPRNYFQAPGYEDNWDVPMCGTRERKPLSWIRMAYPEKGHLIKSDSDKATDPERLLDIELHTESANVYEVWFRDSTVEKYFVDENGAEAEKGEERERSKYPHGRVKAFAGSVLLEDKPYNYKHNKPPYVILYDYLIPHEWVGMGEGDQMEELNISINRILQLLDQWTAYYCDPPWMLDTNSGLEIEKIKTHLREGGGMFECDMRATEEPIKKVKTPEPAEILHQLLTAYMKFLEHITGVTDITKGMTTKAQEQSATEISTMIESAYTRTRQRVRNVEQFIKRLLYLMLEIQQQFYSDTRYFSRRVGDNVDYMQLSNSKDYAASTIQSQNPGVQTTDEQQQEEQDYQEFIKHYGEVDEIYAEFDLEIQTNSTLPMDRQSHANLFLRLLQQAAPNPATALPIWEATLERLQVPKWKQIVDQMKQLQESQNQGAQR